jgi:hypothetical protein
MKFIVNKSKRYLKVYHSNLILLFLINKVSNNRFYNLKSIIIYQQSTNIHGFRLM